MARPSWWSQSSNRPGQYQRVQVLNAQDFTGGLNLVADTFRLAENESPDMVNVDVDRRGGFQVRRGVAPYGSVALGADPDNLWQFVSGASSWVVAQVGANLKSTTGGAWTTLLTAASAAVGSATAVCRPTVFNNTNYIVRGNASVVAFTGPSTVTTMAAAFNSNMLSPTSGNVPRAKTIASHNGYMWVANTFESGTQYPSRIRWSHPNSAENWRSEDYIDIDIGKDGDQITGLVPAGDHLLVFKRDSTYAIYGYDYNTFSVVTVSNTVGCVSQEACVNTPYGVAFFDHDLGLHIYGGKGGTRWAFSQIWPAMRDGDIPVSKIDGVQVGWVKGRLWVGVPWGTDAAARAMTFVWDPQIKEGGTWTQYNLKTGPFLDGHMTGVFCAAMPGTSMVMALEQEEYGDDFGDGVLAIIDAWYRTRWFDAGQPSMKKRWRRMEAVMQTDLPYDLNVDVFINYDPTQPKKSFKLSTSSLNSESADAVWDDSDWDSDLTVYADDGMHGSVDRGSGLGLAKSVSLKFGGRTAKQGTSTVPVFWGVDALVFKYIPRRIR